MASDLNLQKVKFQTEEEEFNQILKQIGGRANIYLVGDVSSNKEDECKCSLMKEFVADVFPVDDLPGESINGEIGSECCSRSKGQCKPDKPEMGARIRTKSEGRDMPCAIVIFIFRHAYIQEKDTRVCVKEVLRDVKSRTDLKGARTALLGLVHAHCESPETGESVVLLEQMLRSVFTKHPQDSIWAGHFVPKVQDGVQAIRRNICKAVLSAQTTDNTPRRQGRFFWPLRRWFRRGRREQADATTDIQVQKDKGESAEEEIPLQMRDGQH